VHINQGVGVVMLKQHQWCWLPASYSFRNERTKEGGERGTT
jgi:hypothetical protein